MAYIHTQDPVFGLVDERAQPFLEAARGIAARGNQALDGVHLVYEGVTDLFHGPLADILAAPVAENLRQMLQIALASSPKSPHDPELGTDSNGATASLRTCAARTREEAQSPDRPLSPRMLLWGIFTTDSNFRALLDAMRGLLHVDVEDVIRQLHRDFEYAVTMPVRGPVRSTSPVSGSLIDVSMGAALEELAHELMVPIQPTPGLLFSQVHKTDRMDALEVLDRSVRYNENKIFTVRGMPGTIMERFGQVLADALADEHPVLPEHRHVITVDLGGAYGHAEAYGIEVAQAALREVLRLAGSRTVVLFQHLEALDQHAHKSAESDVAQHMIAILRQLHGVAAVALYWMRRSDDSLPSISVLQNPLYPGVKVEVGPFSRAGTQRTIVRHFLQYWQQIEHCQVDETAFEDIYVLAPWAHFNEAPITLPYIGIFLGTNACKTITTALQHSLFLEERVNRALSKLHTLQTDAARVKGLPGNVVQVLASIGTALRELKRDSQIALVGQDMPHVTRAHVTAELLGSGMFDVRLAEPPIAIPSDDDDTSSDPDGSEGSGPTGPEPPLRGTRSSTRGPGR